MSHLKHPIRSIREPFGKAGLTVAILALVMAMVGGAYAAGGLTKSQEKQVKKIAKKYAGKPGAAGANGTNGTNGSPGAKGAPGEPGEPGEPGPEGPEGALGTAGTTLPKEATETGTWFASEIGGLLIAPISFPIPLAASLAEGHVHYINPAGKEVIFNGGVEEVDPTKCGIALTPHGTAAHPAAAPGNLCVYAVKAESTTISSYIHDPTLHELGDGEETGHGSAATTGADILFIGSSPEQDYGTWAVTAP